MLLLASLLSISYVAVIRLREPSHLALLPRNNEQVIRYRITRVSLLCLAILIALPPLLVYLDLKQTYGAVFRQFGIIPGYSTTHDYLKDLQNVALVIAKVSVLYMGPIANYLYTANGHLFVSDFRACFFTLQGFRDHVFAPVSEELVYRAAVISVLYPEYLRARIMMLTPVLFGLAHLHHAYTMYFHENESFISVALTVTFQFAYTTAFGGLSNKIYFDTSFNFWAAVILHATCNLFGFPSFDWRQDHPKWFWGYCLMLVGGVWGFWLFL